MNLNSTNMNFLLLSVLALSSCKPSIDPTPSEVTVKKSDLILAYESMPDGNTYALAGDTTRPNTLTPLHPLSNQSLNLNALKGSDGSLRYVAIGASLTAGVRDGGWFNEGINTAYPNLIARQMGLMDFKQPLFDDKEFNGYGQKLPVQNSKTPVYKAVSNNLAFKPSGVEMVLSPFAGTQLDNFAVPNLIYGGFNDDLKNLDVSSTYYKLYLKRMLNETPTLTKSLNNKSFSFYSIEYYTQELIRFAQTGGLSQIYIYDEDNYFTGNTTGGVESFYGRIATFKKSKGFLLNVPDVLNMPYFKDSTRYGGKRAKIDPNYLHGYENSYNKHIVFIGNRYNVPVIDIKTMYEQIHKGDYVSESSKKVTDSVFFSSDGIYPSAYGQALIANECIKTINSFYKTTIPLIQTDYYLNR